MELTNFVFVEQTITIFSVAVIPYHDLEQIAATKDGFSVYVPLHQYLTRVNPINVWSRRS